MHVALFTLGFLAPHAAAVAVDTIGTAGPGVTAMWQYLKEVLPFYNVGSAGPLLIAGKVIRFLFTLIGGVAVAVLIYAGIQLIGSRGNDEALTEAKKMATYALGGVVLAILADTIIGFMLRVIWEGTL